MSTYLVTGADYLDDLTLGVMLPKQTRLATGWGGIWL